MGLSLTSYRMIRLQERKKFRQLWFERLFNEGPFNPRLAYSILHLAVKTGQPQRTDSKGSHKSDEICMAMVKTCCYPLEIQQNKLGKLRVP